MEDMIKITGLWKHKDRNNNTFLSGALSGITQLAVMPNTFKRNEKDPDYFLYIKSSKKKGEQSPTNHNDTDL